MAVDQTNVVDFIGVDPNQDEALLVISDHLAWNEGEQHDREHMYLLQEKINAYLRFIESGELYVAYPKARGKKAVIKVVSKYDMSNEGMDFFRRIEEALFASGYVITFERLKLS